MVNGSLQYFKFTVLPFGLSVGPFVFMEIQKALTKHWRSQGIRIFTYLDDGAGADSDFYEGQRVSNLVRKEVQHSGFVTNEEKSRCAPVQSGKLTLIYPQTFVVFTLYIVSYPAVPFGVLSEYSGVWRVLGP